MAANIPLTQCDPPQLDWSRGTIPAAGNFDDIYFSTDGGLAETQTVFLGGCDLPERWLNDDIHVIGELGFGSGLNFLASWKLWQETQTRNQRLHYISIEKHPFNAKELSRALSAWPQLTDYATQLLVQWPDRVKGFHRLHFDDVTLTLIHDDIRPALAELDAKIDSWFLDGFSPSKNPDMWTEEVMKKIAALSASNARLATFTVAGGVRTALVKAGFHIEKKKGFGRKRHRLVAKLSQSSTAKHPRNLPSHPIIIGAGIAGSSLARAFARRGITPHIVHDSNHIAASHNAAALIKPRLDLQDRPESRFFLASYLYARHAYHSHKLSEGITHLPQSDTEAARYVKLAAQAPLPPCHLSYAHDRLHLGGALVIAPKLVLADWLAGHEIADAAQNTMLKTNEAVKLYAAGFGMKTLLADHTLNLRFSRGQLSWAQNHAAIDQPLTYGGYALPLNDGLLLGATHNQVNSITPFEIQPNDDTANYDALLKATGLTAQPSHHPSRASIRVTTADTLPIMGKISANEWIFTGLGSRGFVFAPLLAEAIVSKICDEPLPVSKKLWARFAAREKPNRKTRP